MERDSDTDPAVEHHPGIGRMHKSDANDNAQSHVTTNANGCPTGAEFWSDDRNTCTLDDQGGC